MQVIVDAVEKIQALKSELIEHLQGFSLLSLRVTNVLESLAHGLAFSTNFQSGEEPINPKPITSMFGLEFGAEVKAAQEVSPVVTQENIEELKQRASEGYSTFLDKSNIEIIDSLSSLEIRAIARLAGMNEVTPTEPQRIDGTFIEQIRNAIAAKQVANQSMEKFKKAKAHNKGEN